MSRAWWRLGGPCALALVAVLSFAPSAAAQRTLNAAIASAHPLATAAGHEILAAGGNAFDAAVAAAAVLAVVEPYSSGLGGGGFWLLHQAANGRDRFVDSRETAPSATRRSDYFSPDGRPLPGATTRGGTAVGIPGVPAALAHIAAQYGRLPLTRSLAPGHHARAQRFCGGSAIRSRGEVA